MQSPRRIATVLLIAGAVVVGLLGSLGDRGSGRAVLLAQDRTFGTDGFVITDIGGNDAAYAIAVGADGRILVAGTTDSSAANRVFALARYNPDGSPDTSFGTSGILTTPLGSGDAPVYAAASLDDGRVVVAGFAENGSDRDFALARYNLDGSLDATFGAGGIVLTDVSRENDVARALCVQTGDRLVVAGLAGGVLTLVRYDTAGKLDISFGNDGRLAAGSADADGAFALACQPDDRLLMLTSNRRDGGSGTRDMVLSRFNADGSADTAFGSAGSARLTTMVDRHSASGLAVDGDGRIMVVGHFTVGGRQVLAYRRITADGRLDTTFGTGGRVDVPISASEDIAYFGAAFQPDGETVLTGYAWNGTNYDFITGRLAGVTGQISAVRTPVPTPALPRTTSASGTPTPRSAPPLPPVEVTEVTAPVPNVAPTAVQPTPAPTVQPARTPTPPPPPGTVVLSDNFDDPAMGIMPRDISGTITEAGYLNGEYFIRKLTNPGSAGVSVPVPGEYVNSSLIVDARVVGDNDGVGIGIYCRTIPTQSGNNGYLFTVKPRSGEVRISIVQNGRGTGIVNTTSSVVNPSIQSNQIEFRCVGASLTGIVNGQIVATASDSNFASGRMSIGVFEDQVRPRTLEARFDNLQVVQQ